MTTPNTIPGAPRCFQNFSKSFSTSGSAASSFARRAGSVKRGTGNGSARSGDNRRAATSSSRLIENDATSGAAKWQRRHHGNGWVAAYGQERGAPGLSVVFFAQAEYSALSHVVISGSLYVSSPRSRYSARFAARSCAWFQQPACDVNRTSSFTLPYSQPPHCE